MYVTLLDYFPQLVSSLPLGSYDIAYLFISIFFMSSFFFLLFCFGFEFVYFEVLVLEEKAIKFLLLFPVIFICAWRFYSVGNGWVTQENQMLKKQCNSSTFYLALVPGPNHKTSESMYFVLLFLCGLQIWCDHYTSLMVCGNLVRESKRNLMHFYITDNYYVTFHKQK